MALPAPAGVGCTEALAWRIYLVLAVLLLLSGCDSTSGSSASKVIQLQPATKDRQWPLGDPDRGRVVMAQYGCGACHVIPGVSFARGEVGPSLTNFGARTVIAGAVPNTHESLVRWIEAPQAVLPGSAMPNLGVTQVDARDIATYLLALRS